MSLTVSNGSSRSPHNLLRAASGEPTSTAQSQKRVRPSESIFISRPHERSTPCNSERSTTLRKKDFRLDARPNSQRDCLMFSCTILCYSGGFMTKGVG
ncbi:hypothetical protein AGOR_G00236860 [Albula goreensis]|uniref:Uncharacterized protein n=1 Tax=Albula goreensis TaxID=1534307 RepID=A0A8T3CFI7_9TELE|nr:hypothetical protein AGOR_G00236860 [Albula goreensis]